MARSIDKVEAFKILLSEDLDPILAPYRQDMDELQLGDDDEQNAQAIETWLATRPPLLKVYEEQLKTQTAANPLLGTPKERIARAEPNPQGSTVKEEWENASKRNTPDPPTPPSKS